MIKYPAVKLGTTVAYMLHIYLNKLHNSHIYR